MTTSDWLFGLAVRVPMRAVGAPVGALASPPPGPLGLPHDEQARQAPWERTLSSGGQGGGAAGGERPVSESWGESEKAPSPAAQRLCPSSNSSSSRSSFN